MKNRITFKGCLPIGFAIVVLILILTAFFCRITMSTKQFLNSLEQESHTIPAYNSLAHFYIDGSSIDWYDVLRDNEIVGHVAEVLVVYNERIYFVLEDHYNGEIDETWSLLSVDKSGENLQIHLSETFGLDGGDASYQCNNNCQEAYWESKNGFYNDGKIILTDHVKLVEYDIKSSNVTLMASADYIYPQNEINVIRKDAQTLLFNYKRIQWTITPDVLAKSSKAFTAFMELKNKETWDGTSRLDRLFSSVQTDGTNIYIVCSAYNWSGETYAIVFQYDIHNDNCAYSFYQYVIDSIDERFYLVPRTEDSLCESLAL